MDVRLQDLMPACHARCLSDSRYDQHSPFRQSTPFPFRTLRILLSPCQFIFKMSRSNDDRSPSLIAVAAAFLVIVVISVSVRIFTRLRLVKWLGADDWLMLCATIASAGLSIGTIVCKLCNLFIQIYTYFNSLPIWNGKTYRAATQGMGTTILDIRSHSLTIIFSIVYVRQVIASYILPKTFT